MIHGVKLIAVMMKKPYISFVVPVFNEAESLVQLHQEIIDLAKTIKKPYEIIFVNDGSFDDSESVARKLKPIILISFRKNFGQTSALDAGIKRAKGKYIVTLDGDLQNNPKDVPKMLKKLINDELDVVCGWRKNRHDDWSKRFLSAGAKWLRSFLVRDNVHDSGCTLRVYRRECFDDMVLRGEMHRFIPALLKWRGFKVGEITVSHRPRKHGQSKYTFSRAIKGLLDMLSLWFFRKFSSRPLHLLGAIGLFLFFVGLIIGLWMFVERVMLQQSIANRIWPLTAVFLMLFGVQMFVSGLIMDLILTTENKPHYMIKEVYEKS